MKRIISFCVIVLIGTGLFSCASSPPRSQTGSSVWKISRDGSALFLGGSVHILRENDYPLPVEFDRAFSQSAMLVLETDVEQLTDDNVLQYLMSRMILPANQTLRSILDSRTFKLLEAAFKEYGLMLDGNSNIKPSMVINILTLLQVQKLGFVQEGVDFYYLEKAKNEKKPMSYLESIETQIDMMVTMGDGYENDYVQYSLYDMENTETGLLSLLDEWKTGGSSKTEEALLEMRDEWPQLYKTVITDRNSAWMPQIEQYLASGVVPFVVVGLMHIHGPDGLLRQLENAGCTVEYF
jgi:uncharacterized protein YbaP (TraB family)